VPPREGETRRRTSRIRASRVSNNIQTLKRLNVGQNSLVVRVDTNPHRHRASDRRLSPPLTLETSARCTPPTSLLTRSPPVWDELLRVWDRATETARRPKPPPSGSRWGPSFDPGRERDTLSPPPLHPSTLSPTSKSLPLDDPHLPPSRPVALFSPHLKWVPCYVLPVAFHCY